MANKHGMIQPVQPNAQVRWAVFNIDLSSMTQIILCYPPSTGRNFYELKRIILALQKADADICTTQND